MIPNVKVKKPVDSSLAKTAIGLNGAGDRAPQFARGFEAQISEVIAESGNLLRIAVQNKISVVKPAHLRHRKWLGKLINTLLRSEHKHIEMHGIELIALTRVLNESLDIEIHPNRTYLIPIDVAESILTRLKNIKWC